MVSETNTLDGEEAEDIRFQENSFVWMDDKAMLTGKDRKAILNSCRLDGAIMIIAQKPLLRAASFWD